jgi:hypothetical protein
MPIISSNIKEIVQKEFVLTDRAVGFAYCCEYNVLQLLYENVRRLRPKLWRHENWLFITTTHRLSLLFHKGIFYKKKSTTVVPHGPYFSVSPIEHKIDTVVMIEAESQAVLNTLTERDFQDAFKKWLTR